MTFEAAGSRAGGHGVTQPEAGPPADGWARADSGSAIPAAKGVTAENTWPGSSEPPGDNRQQLPARSRRKLTQGVMHTGAAQARGAAATALARVCNYPLSCGGFFLGVCASVCTLQQRHRGGRKTADY